MAVLGVMLAYLLGSISFGVLVGWGHHTEIRSRDLPGASGVFRRVGMGWGLLVGLLDLAKGMAAVGIAYGLGLEGWALGAVGAAAVLGHCYPLYFGFRGGGGILTAAGFVLAVVPELLATGAAVGLAVAGVYYLSYWRGHRHLIYPLPLAAAIAGLVLILLMAVESRDWGPVLPPVLALAARGASFRRSKG